MNSLTVEKTERDIHSVYEKVIELEKRNEELEKQNTTLNKENHDLLRRAWIAEGENAKHRDFYLIVRDFRRMQLAGLPMSEGINYLKHKSLIDKKIKEFTERELSELPFQA